MVNDSDPDNIEARVAAEVGRVLSNDRMAIRAFYMIVSTTAIFGLIGGLMGWVMAIVTPAYFRDVYDTLESDVWQVAIGMGVTWGLIAGLASGCSVLLATAWYRSRIKQALAQQYNVDQQKK